MVSGAPSSVGAGHGLGGGLLGGGGRALGGVGLSSSVNRQHVADAVRHRVIEQRLVVPRT